MHTGMTKHDRDKDATLYFVVTNLLKFHCQHPLHVVLILPQLAMALQLCTVLLRDTSLLLTFYQACSIWGLVYFAFIFTYFFLVIFFLTYYAQDFAQSLNILLKVSYSYS